VLSTQAVSYHGWPFVQLGTLLSSVIGALILMRDHRHRIGWLFLLVGTIESVSLFTESFGYWNLNSANGSTRVGQASLWIDQFSGATWAFAGLAVLFLIAPTGQISSPRGRWVLWAAVAGLVLWTVGMFDVPLYSFRADGTDDVPGLAGAALAIAVTIIFGAVLAGAVSFLRRLRRARGEQRQQLRWIAVPIALFPVTLLFLMIVNITHQDGQVWYQGLPIYIDYMALSVCTGVALLRYNLWDVDVVINRTILVIGAAAFASAGYIGLVVLIGGSVPGFWPSVAASVAVALAFQPVRRSLVRLADRLAYGDRAVPLEELAELNRRIGDTAEATSLGKALAAAVGGAVRAQRVSVRLEVADGEVLSTDWHSAREVAGGDVMTFPVMDGARVLGGIDVTIDRARPLRSRDRELLTDLATQAAPALRNVQLAAELEAKVRQLDAQSAELARSRARLLAARDAEQARIARTVHRRVTPHLDRVAAAVETDSPPDLDALIGEVNSALQALRHITHGIFPAELARFGLATALRTHLRGAAFDQLDDARFDEPVELAAYFCCVEAAELLAPSLRVSVAAASDQLSIDVEGTGVRSADLSMIIDRLAPLEGTAVLGGSAIEIRIPATPVTAGSAAMTAAAAPG
jgi:GAF domain-containing protein